VAVFFITFVLMAGPLRKDKSQKAGAPQARTAIFLSCAILAVAVHNLTDFAIFEPGVLTVFWAIAACLIATNSQSNPPAQLTLKSATLSRLPAVAGGFVIAVVYLSYVLIPVARSTGNIRRANQAVSIGQWQEAHELLEKAGEADPLGSTAPAFGGRLYLHGFDMTPGGDPDLLLRAAASLKSAIERNGAAFKNFERLADVYMLLAENSPGRERTDWLKKALDAAYEALKRYPGCGRLHFKLARIAEKSDDTKVAIKHYQRAIEIEDAYRDQFRRMYPEREEVVSRIGEDKYMEAMQRLESLGGQLAPNEVKDALQ